MVILEVTEIYRGFGCEACGSVSPHCRKGMASNRGQFLCDLFLIQSSVSELSGGIPQIFTGPDRKTLKRDRQSIRRLQSRGLRQDKFVCAQRSGAFDHRRPEAILSTLAQSVVAQVLSELILLDHDQTTVLEPCGHGIHDSEFTALYHHSFAR